MPRQSRALDAYGKLTNARKHSQLSQTFGWTVRRSGNHPLEALEERGCLFDGLPFYAFGHERRRRFRNRAARSLKADVLDRSVFHFQVNRHAVAAQRIEPFRTRAVL